MKAIVKDIQVGGYVNCEDLLEACEVFVNSTEKGDLVRSKICFMIKLPNGTMKQITIRDEGHETVAYGDFEGLPSMLEYAEEIL